MSKQDILKNIRKNRPTLVRLDEIPTLNKSSDCIDEFIANASINGSNVIKIKEHADFHPILNKMKDKFDNIVNALDGELDWSKDLQIDLLIIKGQVGVAENGAIWIDEHEYINGLPLFLAEHLMIVIEQKSIVPTMDLAYQNIKIDNTPFGLFIAGPSKTADIEQSLVTGAQAARSLQIVILT